MTNSKENRKGRDHYRRGQSTRESKMIEGER